MYSDVRVPANISLYEHIRFSFDLEAISDILQPVFSLLTIKCS